MKRAKTGNWAVHQARDGESHRRIMSTKENENISIIEARNVNRDVESWRGISMKMC